jgi:phage terminase large subunit
VTTIQELDDLEYIVNYAIFQVGCDPDQLDRFVRFGYIPQAKQMVFHAAAREADEPTGPERIGYGGTRGQAKSHAILAQVGMDDCQRFPGLKVLYLRNIGKAAAEQFEDLITKMFLFVPHVYKSSKGLLNFPNGSRIILGGFKDESEIDGYLGIEYDLIVLEDATTLSESKYNAICGSLRTSKTGWRPRLYASANPGGIGHAWFKRIFVDPWLQKKEAFTRFIHTVMGDNVFIDEGYARYLNSLTGWLRRAWRDGDFSIAAGQFFTNFDPNIHVIDPFPIPPNWTVWASMDYGSSHWNVVHLFTKDGDGNRYVIDEYAVRRTLIPHTAGGIKAMLERNGLRPERLNTFVAGTDVFIKKFIDKPDEEARSIADEYRKHGINFTPAETDRINGAARIMTYLGSKEDPPIPARLFIFRRCKGIINQLPDIQHDPKRGEDVLKVDCNIDTGEGGDDFYDCLRYGMMIEFSAPPAGATTEDIDTDVYRTHRERRAR